MVSWTFTAACRTGGQSLLITLPDDAAQGEQVNAIGGSSQLRKEDDLYQPTDTYLIELKIAQRLSRLVAGAVAQQP